MDVGCSMQTTNVIDYKLLMSSYDTFKFSLLNLFEDSQCVAYPDMSTLASLWEVELRCVRNNTNRNLIGLWFDLFRKDFSDLHVQIELEVNMRMNDSNAFNHRCVSNCSIRGHRQSSSFFMWISSPKFRFLDSNNLNADIEVKLRDSFTTAIANPLSQTIECHSRMCLQTDLSIFYQMQNWSDVILYTADGQTLAHKLILRARSPVFRRLLLEDPEFVNVQSMSRYELDVFLKYIYTGHFNESTIKTVVAVYKAAVEYEVISLLFTCSRILMSNIRLDSVCDILGLAEENNDLSLKEAAVSFIRANFSDVKVMKGFQTLSNENPKAYQTIQKALGISNFSIQPDIPSVKLMEDICK